MRQRIKVIRRRVGRVSFYQHHDGWWVYHREFGKPVRHLVGQPAEIRFGASSPWYAPIQIDHAAAACDLRHLRRLFVSGGLLRHQMQKRAWTWFKAVLESRAGDL